MRSLHLNLVLDTVPSKPVEFFRLLLLAYIEASGKSIPFLPCMLLKTDLDESPMNDRVSCAVPTLGSPNVALRRFVFFTLVGISIFGLETNFIAALSPGGFDLLDAILSLLFLFILPWSVIGFWNAAIGFVLMRRPGDAGAGLLMPGASSAETPITMSTAILLTIRNEVLEPVERAARIMLDGLAASGEARHFHLYLLSDTTDAAIAAAEERMAAAITADHAPHLGVTYRRRSDNAGFKAGNIRDFCERWGASHDFMITLDADSLMSARAMLRLVRLMESDRRLGIVQQLTIGLPAVSPFARIFQFGMRLGMRSYTLGSAWWQGECGPYWGHNAILRLAPFVEHCHLPPIPGDGPLSGTILSHDQVEAILMRRAGYDCRVLVDETGSYEANPTTLTEFIRRDLRWCQGNMQYLRLLGLPGASAISQYQLVFAILMFIGSPAAVLLTGLAALRLLLAADPAAVFDGRIAQLILAAFILMSLAPKLATLADILVRKALRTAYGGGAKVLMGSSIETLFVLLTLPIMTVSEALFLVSLALRRRLGWGAQNRADHSLSWREAARILWPHTLLGIAGAGAFAAVSNAAFWWSLPLMLGPMLSIPLAVLTSSQRFGRFMLKHRLCALPEEKEPPPELVALGLPALDEAA